MDMTIEPTLSAKELPTELQQGLQAIHPIMGGLTNRSWKLQRDGGDCIWRPHSTLLSDLGISRESEYRVLQLLSEQSFAPNVIHYSPSGIANQWIEGQPLFVSPSHSTMVDVMKGYHSLPVESHIDLPTFDYLNKINTYWNAIKPENRFEDLTALYEFASTSPDMPSSSGKHCLLHCDLGYYNLIETPQQIAIIDWEYASVGDPLIDVVLTAMACRYRLDTFVSTYYQTHEVDLEKTLQAAYELRFRFEIMSALWFVVCYQYNNDDSYMKEAIEMANTLCNSDHSFSS
jgi:thiamine kinase